MDPTTWVDNIFFTLFKISKWIFSVSYLWLLLVQVKFKKKSTDSIAIVNYSCPKIIKIVRRFVRFNFSTRNKLKQKCFSAYSTRTSHCVLPQKHLEHDSYRIRTSPLNDIVFQLHLLCWRKVAGGHQFLFYEKDTLSVLTTFTKTRVSGPFVMGTIGSGKQGSSWLTCPRLGWWPGLCI